MSRIITSVDELDFEFSSLQEMPLPSRVLMVRPTYFSVEYVINPYMAENVGTVDQSETRNEWEVVRQAFAQIGVDPQITEGQEGLPDMCFSANQSLPFLDENGTKHVIMSVMHSRQRKGEVPYIEEWYRENGYIIHHLDESEAGNFEGCGDAVWHAGKCLLWGAYGFRSTLNVYEQISAICGAPVIALQLVDEAFYHLDTCFCVLDRKTALIYPRAFTDEGLALIYGVFERVIRANKHEARDLFACNACCPDGENVIIQQGSTDVNNKLRDAGFIVHEVDTSEFLKSGGSVFCLKQLVW